MTNSASGQHSRLRSFFFASFQREALLLFPVLSVPILPPCFLQLFRFFNLLWILVSLRMDTTISWQSLIFNSIFLRLIRIENSTKINDISQLSIICAWSNKEHLNNYLFLLAYFLIIQKILRNKRIINKWYISAFKLKLFNPIQFMYYFAFLI